MRLYKATIRPGTVREILENGIIKASAPGLFSFKDDTNNMPPIIPLCMGGNSGVFSKVKLYDEVWIMNFLDNPRQLYWFRKDRIEENENLINTINSEENVEVICNRDVAGDWCTIYFSDGSGWVIGKGESIIQIRPDGSILLSTDMPNRNIDITSSGISIGSVGGSAHPVAYGDEVESALREICALLGAIGISASANPFTVPIGTTIMSKIGTLANKIGNISSPHVTVD